MPRTPPPAPPHRDDDLADLRRIVAIVDPVPEHLRVAAREAFGRLPPGVRD